MIKRVVAGGSGLSILGTAIYFLTRHIGEVQYNNWGNGVWNGLLTINGTGNCSSDSSTKDNEYYKSCIKKDIEDYYDLQDIWNSDYWKNWYQLKTSPSQTTNGNIGDKLLKLGSWEKFRELCTKGFDEMIKKKEWSKLSGSLGTSSSTPIGEINSEECLRGKSVTVSKK